ncbi:MAG: MmcQ/YjbR family DNA-binding protein [Azospirillaceae bacterium]
MTEDVDDQRAVAPETGIARLRERALAYPETREDFPWGEPAYKVRDKVFVFLAVLDGTVRFTAKLPRSRDFALEYPFTAPTGYGLGRSGWVTAEFPPGEPLPLDLLTGWMDESYRAVAPKALVGRL